MGIEIAALIATATTLAVGVQNFTASQDAAAAQKSLANQQAKELRDQQSAQAAEAAKQALTGQTFGFDNSPAGILKTGFGFGTAPAASANAGRGQITGMG